MAMGMKTPPALADTRRLNFKRLIQERYEGSIAAFSRATDKNPNLMALVLSNNPTIRRTMGERQAREIEAKMGLPERWLDVERGPSSEEKYHTFEIVEMNEVAGFAVEKLTYSVAALQRLIEPYGSLGALKLMRASTNEMTPTISMGDLMFVDTSVTTYAQPGVYVINRESSVFLRRVKTSLSGTVRISADSDAEFIDAQPGEYRPSGRVVGTLRFAKP
jgi:hypothetical protein